MCGRSLCDVRRVESEKSGICISKLGNQEPRILCGTYSRLEQTG